MRKAIGYLLGITMLITISGCARTMSWQEQYDLGVRYLSEGNYEEAIIAFTAAIEIDPKQATAYIARGDSYVGQASLLTAAQGADDSFNSAAADYLAAIDLDPYAVEAYEKLSAIYIEQGDFDTAVKILERGYEATKDERLSDLLDMLRKEPNGLAAALLEGLERMREELEGPVTVTGRIIYNLDEYRDTVYAYMEAFHIYSSDVVIAHDAYGIRFEPAQKVITENGIEYITEARTDGMWDTMESLVGHTVELTGYFGFTGEAGFSGPYPPGTHNGNKFTEYWFNPSPWRFTIESYEIVE